MKKILLVLAILFIVATLTSCSNAKGDPGIIGYVMKTDSADRILVIDSNPQDFSSTGGVNEFYNAIWFSNVPKNITIGQKVKVWFDIVRESYPAQSDIEHIEVVPSPKPSGAALNESQALNKALTSPAVKDLDLLVKTIEYNNKAKRWTIELKELWSEKTHTLEVKNN